jgi:NAD(P)-dependent dehydrogenase (short-subunit alcohol dehydrogenase family)
MEPALATLITGASSGIGRSAAARLSRGRVLILHGRNVERLEETRRLCENPTAHLLWPFELASVGDIAASLASLLAESGALVEAFVHCAGAATVLPMKGLDYRAMRAALDVNFCSAAEIVHTLLKKKINQQRLANIVFVSSIFSPFGARGHAAYCASKAALDGLMRALAVELAPAVRVNSVLPGAVRTAMAADGFADPEIAAKLERDYPLGVGRPEDVADALEFLLSPQSRWLTGQQVVVDGGRTVNMSLK